MNVIFCGSTKFGLSCYKALKTVDGVDVLAIIGLKSNRFKISYSVDEVSNVNFVDFESIAQRDGLPFIACEGSLNESSIVEKLAELAPSAFLVAGWYHMIGKKVRAIAPCFGLHASLLPDYAGGAPLVWAMINGESRTGVTLFEMDDGVDTGPIVGQREVGISNDDEIKTLYSKIELQACDLIAEKFTEMSEGHFTKFEQDFSNRRHFPQRSPADGLIDWSWSAEYVCRWIRAQTKPYPGAFFLHKGKKIIIWKATLLKTDVPFIEGKFIQTKTGSVSIKCSDHLVQLNEIEHHNRIYKNEEIADFLSNLGLI